jgi:hypothetical protein
VRLYLTDAGQARQRELGTRHARDVARALGARVSSDELATLAAICQKLAAPAGTALPPETKEIP